MKSTVVTYAKNKLKGAQPDLTALIKADAIGAQWPKPIVSSLIVSIDDSKLIIVYPDQYAQEVDDLEYGTRGASPKPVFRLFLTKHEDVVLQKITEASLNYLEEEGIIP